MIFPVVNCVQIKRKQVKITDKKESKIMKKNELTPEERRDIRILSFFEFLFDFFLFWI